MGLHTFKTRPHILKDRLSVWLTDRNNLVFLILIFAHLVPIWIFPYFPSQDGPAHIENASILRNYGNPDASLLREYYTINPDPNPNWFGHLALAVLMLDFSPLVAEKVFLTGYVLLLPVSIRYALRGINPANVFLCFFAFPFIYNFLFHMGFYNFSYSLPAYFFVLGYWLRNKEDLTTRTAAIMAFLLVLLYFCHLVSWVMAIVAISLLTLWSILFDAIASSRPVRFHIDSPRRIIRKRVLPMLLAFLPTCILVLVFLGDHGLSTSNRWSTLDLLKHLLTLSSLWSYERYSLLLSTPLVCIFGALTIRLVAFNCRNRKLTHLDGLVLVCLVYVVLYFAIPDSMSSGDYVTPRLLLFPFLSLLLWLATGSFGRTANTRIVVTASVISCLLLAMHTVKYAELNEQLEEYMSATHIIEEGTTLLPLSFAQKGLALGGDVLSERPRPFLFTSGYIAAEKRIVELHNYEARTEYFPLRYRPNLNPFLHIWLNKSLYVSPQVQFLDYSERTAGRVDYVLLWGYSDDLRDQQNVQSILSQLKTGYTLVYTSMKGRMQLYRRRALVESFRERSTPEFRQHEGAH